MTAKPKRETVRVLIRKHAMVNSWYCTVRVILMEQWCFDGRLQKTARDAMAEAEDFCQRMDKEIVDRTVQKE